MARTIAQIKQQMVDEKNAQSDLNDLTSTSQTAIWNLVLFVVATGIALFEQLQDIFKEEIEALVALAAPATPQWIQDRVFKFQYDSTTPQVVTLVDFVPGYATVNENKRIITRCSVKTDVNRLVKIKVAKSDPPAALASAEKTSLESYLDHILPAGIQRNVISLAADRLYVDAEIFYNGQYSATIETDVIDAINNYLSELPFDGIVKISAIEDAIQAVAGVDDVVINTVKARPNATPFSGATTVARIWETVAGYIIEEDTAGQTFADSLTFTAVN